MTTFNSDGKSIGVAGGAAPDDEQLTPPEDLDVDTDEDDDTARRAAEIAAESQIEDAEVEVIESPAGVEGGPDGQLAKARAEDVNTAIALDTRFDVTKAGETWPYDMLEFKGDLLGIRLPARQALAAFSLASSKYVSMGVKNDLTGLFIARHLSPESYGRVFSRLMDPDETDYDVDTVGDLFNAIVTAAINADEAEGDDSGK